MRIGILADIHEDAPALKAALHVWRDPNALPLEAQIEKGFARRSERVLFYGHIHRWLVATPKGEIGWDGDRIRLRRPVRYTVAVSALSGGVGGRRRGHFALYDTDTEMLTRLRV